ncbi:MAG TPA: farnesyl diphosphate synthase [Clostridia bacterium]|nr:farnesyl diphosphate synthase [Clostridia bacterium]
MDFNARMDKLIQLVNDSLDDYLAIREGSGSNIYNAMKYSLMAGGKRLRPVLALAVCELFGGNRNEVLPFACAIEMIHTYSLIHDDLPAMDNDDYRRGVPTNHKVFGEAMAILAGDALLNGAYELMLEASHTDNRNMEARLKAMQIIARAAGAEGMIRGQVVDMESEGKSIEKDTLEFMHRCKTGALIKAPVVSSAVLSGASEKDIENLGTYAEKIGLAFQIKDDIMDVKGDPGLMGKAVGSDAASGKSTYVTLYGMENAQAMLEKTIDDALTVLEDYGDRADFLKTLAVFIKDRDH